MSRNQTPKHFSSCQKEAWQRLLGKESLFITGYAGTGKSYLMNHFLKYSEETSEEGEVQVLASTGSAAVLVGGRTFHSFFGLGVLEGGKEKTIDRALKRPQLLKRIKKAKTLIVDEVSMLSALVLDTAEELSRTIRNSYEPWGGIRMIFVGDFAQLPPVDLDQKTGQKPWAFLSDAWFRTECVPIPLRTTIRTDHEGFIQILNDIRNGKCTENVLEFFKERSEDPEARNLERDDCTFLFPRRNQVEGLNQTRLQALPGDPVEFPTVYSGKAQHVQNLKKITPIPEILALKEGALVMIRVNDPQGRYVNGSQGYVIDFDTKKLKLKLISGADIELEKNDFYLYDAEGEVLAKATNFPINLAYAMTIHKAQGCTVDRLTVSLSGLWEPGQAYVALSRAQSPYRLWIQNFHPKSILSDPQVQAFHEAIELV